jgi:hypothetical protein
MKILHIQHVKTGVNSDSHLLNVHDLPINKQGAKMVLFAADTNIQIKATIEDILNKKINRVMQQLLIRFQVNGLLIHTKKTIAMSFHTRQVF